MSIYTQDSLWSETMSQLDSYSLRAKYTPETILEPREDAPPGRIWCKHCEGYLMIGAESVSHQNLVRPSQLCTVCSAWNYLDEKTSVIHTPLCPFKGGDMVKLAMGGSQSRATVVPSTKASQVEAASWPHV
jgi:hypothetical protein